MAKHCSCGPAHLLLCGTRQRRSERLGVRRARLAARSSVPARSFTAGDAPAVPTRTGAEALKASFRILATCVRGAPEFLNRKRKIVTGG